MPGPAKRLPALGAQACRKNVNDGGDVAATCAVGQCLA
jgi:hypothetical protein